MNSCPFCGAEDDGYSLKVCNGTQRPIKFVRCVLCGAQGAIAISNELAVMNWDHRPEDYARLANEDEAENR